MSDTPPQAHPPQGSPPPRGPSGPQYAQVPVVFPPQVHAAFNAAQMIYKAVGDTPDPDPFAGEDFVTRDTRPAEELLLNASLDAIYDYIRGVGRFAPGGGR